MDEFYSAQQIESVLDELGIHIVSETDTNFICYCAFHRNTDTPALSISKETGQFLCFAPQCDVRGSLVKLVKDIGKINIYQAKRLIDKYESVSGPLSKIVEDLFNRTEELPPFDINVINRMHDEFWQSVGHVYMKDRRYEDITLSNFSVGYSSNRNLVAIPVYDWNGNSVGVVGRSIVEKTFHNSKLLPSRTTLFNIHKAKKCGDSVIIVEAALDAMMIHQAGYPNVIATNGGFFTDAHRQLVDKYFNEVIIMTDYDIPKSDPYCKKCENTCIGHSPGQILANKIESTMSGKRIRFACYDYGKIYPDNAKDAGDMTGTQIKQCISNAITSTERIWMAREFPELRLVD